MALASCSTEAQPFARSTSSQSRKSDTSGSPAASPRQAKIPLSVIRVGSLPAPPGISIARFDPALARLSLSQTPLTSFDRLFAVVLQRVPLRCGMPKHGYGLSHLITIGLSQGGIWQQQSNSDSHKDHTGHVDSLLSESHRSESHRANRPSSWMKRVTSQRSARQSIAGSDDDAGILSYFRAPLGT